LNLERSIGNIAKRLDRIDPLKNDRENGLNYWKGKPIISLEEWIQLKDTPRAVNYLPDDFHIPSTFIPEPELQHKDEDTKRWYSDYLELMNYTKNENYGRAKCFHCLLDPGGNDPIFIGINRLVSKALKPKPEYPCRVANRFHCPYEKENNSKDKQFEVDDLFGLQKMAFAVEISLAKARKEDSRIRVGNKEELLHALTDKDTLTKILEQGTQAHEVSDDIRTYLAENQDYILDYFTHMKDNVNLEELRFY
jgi:hypothetical protein